jgi:hypothetical protein
MELVHRKTGVARLIGKAVLVGIFVIVFAKAILALLALACVGLLVFCCARGLYLGRAKLKRIAIGVEKAIQSASGVAWGLAAFLLVAARSLLLGAYGTLLWLSRFAKNACALLGPTMMVCGSIVWQGLLRLHRAACVMLRSLFSFSTRTLCFFGQLPTRGCRIVAGAAKFIFIKIQSQAHVIGGTLVEATCGAVVGVLVFNLPSIGELTFLPDVNALESRICAAALFGAFLGAVLGLSRLRWVREGEAADSSKSHT